MPKSQPLKYRLAAQLADLSNGGQRDGDIAKLVGGLAVSIADGLKVEDWPAAKARMTDPERSTLLADIDRNAAERLRTGQGKHVYALQLIGISVAASADPDPGLREGEKLLDDYVAAAARLYRLATQRRP